MRPVVHGEIRADALLGVVGEAPGPEEERQGRPFIGASGRVLAEGASVGALNREGMSILNVSEILVEDEEQDVHLARMAADVVRLREEFGRLTSARTLLLIGADAAEAVLGLCGPQKDPLNPKRKLTPSIMDYHGSVFSRSEALTLQAWAAENRIPTTACLPPQVHTVMVTMHPAFALHTHKVRIKLSILTAIGRAAMRARHVQGPVRPAQSIFHLTPSADEVDAFLRRTDPLPITADVETPRDNHEKILLCGVGTMDAVYSFPWVEPYPRPIREWFERPGHTVGHNFLFDLRAFAAYGIRPGRLRRILDTIVECGLLHPVDDEVREFPWLSLATCVARHNPGTYFWKESERTCQRALYKASYPWCDPSLYDRLYNAVDVYENSCLQPIVATELLRAGMM